MQQNKLYVGNFPYSVNENDLRDLFASYGPIEDVRLLCDKCHRAEHRLDAHRARMKEQNGETDSDVAPSWLTMLAEDREPAKLKRRTAAEVAKEEAERDRFLRTNDSFGNYAHLKRKPKTPWDRPSP